MKRAIQVTFDGAHREKQHLGDLLIAHSLRRQLRDFAFAGSQRTLRCCDRAHFRLQQTLPGLDLL